MDPAPGPATFPINGGETTLYYRDPEEEGLSLRDVFSLLESRRRRCALYFLTDTSEIETDFETLRDAVIDYEKRCEDPPEAPDTVTISLEHVHLPRLDQADVIDWDREDRTIEYLGHPLVERWLSETQHLDIQPEK